VLFLALGVSFGIGSYIEGGVVTAVVVLNIVVGFFQEFSAEKTMESLRGLSSPSANVIRNGHAKQVPSPELVPGDLIEVPPFASGSNGLVENGRYSPRRHSNHRSNEL
jgi:magnesium-transporting ATPase (P-type)